MEDINWNERLNIIRGESEVGYTSYSGIEITEISEGFAEGRINIQEHHLNPGGAVHGGTIFCLSDVVGGVAVKTIDYLPVTVNSSISYMRPMRGDRVIYARAHVLRAGKKTAFVEISILNEHREETARTLATYQNVKGGKKS